MSDFPVMKLRCADALADEVAVLVQRRIIDARSPAADALLDYREPPRTERADRLVALESEIATLRERVEALQRFKDYCHARMDAAGIDADPESPHRAEGCRIGGRFDVLVQQRDSLRERVAELGKLLAIARSDASFEHDACEVARQEQARAEERVAEVEAGLRELRTIAERAGDHYGIPSSLALRVISIALSPPAAVEPTPAREESIYTVMRVPAEILVPAPADELRRRALAADRAYLGLPTPAPAPGALTLTPPAPGLTVDVPPREKTPAPDLLDGTVYGAGAVERRPGHASGMDPARCGDGCSGCATCCGCHACHPTPQREEVDRGD